jgi:hypothetical protein
VLNVPAEEMLARAGRSTGGTPGGADADAASPDAATRIQELEQQVREQERELAELRRLLGEREERASGR